MSEIHNQCVQFSTAKRRKWNSLVGDLTKNSNNYKKKKKKGSIFPFSPNKTFTYSCCCMERLEDLSGSEKAASGSSSLKYPHIVCRKHSPTKRSYNATLHFQKYFFSKDFTDFSAQSFHSISVSALGICLHLFQGKIQLFLIVITKVTFTKWYRTWHKWFKLL